jgi:hypothetical protein
MKLLANYGRKETLDTPLPALTKAKQNEKKKKMTDRNERLRESLTKAIENSLRLLLTGPPSCGKTTVILRLAERNGHFPSSASLLRPALSWRVRVRWHARECPIHTGRCITVWSCRMTASVAWP